LRKIVSPLAMAYRRRMTAPGESSAERLLAHPGVQRAPSDKLELFQRKRFLPPDLCAELIRLIDLGRRPSTIADANGDMYFRTSETCDLDAAEPAVRDLEARLLSLTGIDPAHGEPVQGQRYEAGQEFKPHTDYFDPHGADFERYCSIAGQRTWTFMIYLSEVEAGGGTRFMTLKKIVQPETGKLLGWNNRRPDGRPNPNTLHHGMKVRKGLKYVITKWYRERPWG
jgi:prolyl 4-hydroxylase